MKVLKHFGLKNHTRKTVTILKDFLNYIKSSGIIFKTKMLQYFRYTYFLQEKLTHFGLEVLVVYEVLGHFSSKNH